MKPANTQDWHLNVDTHPDLRVFGGRTEHPARVGIGVVWRTVVSDVVVELACITSTVPNASRAASHMRGMNSHPMRLGRWSHDECVVHVGRNKTCIDKVTR